MSGPSAKILGIVIATRWEAAEILRRFGFRKIGKDLYRTRVNGRDVLLALSGVGRARAAQAAERLYRAGARELLSMGFCGALAPELKIGDAVQDRIATVDTPVRTPQERRALTQRSGAVAVDMETRAVVELGTLRGIPIGVLRVVSDPAGEDLTPLLGRDAGFSKWRVAWRLMRPAAWPLAARLRRNSAIAKTRLDEVLAGRLQAEPIVR